MSTRIGPGLRPLVLLPILIFLSACNHLFYYPDPYDRKFLNKQGIAHEDIWLNSEDGTRLHGLLLPAQGEVKGTVVHFHGNAENLSTHVAFLAWIVDHGFNLLVFDYRGYGKSAGKAKRNGTILDGIAVLDWVHQNPSTADTDLFIVGQSLGGAIAVVALAKRPQIPIRTLVLDSTFSSYRHIARQKLGSFWLTWPLQWPLSFLISDELSPRDFIEQVSTPTVFIHSKRDPVVPYACGYDLYQAAREPKDLWVLEGPWHTAAFIMDDDMYRERLLSTLCAHAERGMAACNADRS